MTEPKARPKRIVLQKIMAAEIEAAVKKAEALIDPADVKSQERLFRAVIWLAARRLFDMGVHPQKVVEQSARAVVEAYEHRMKSALIQGQPFGPLPVGKA